MEYHLRMHSTYNCNNRNVNCIPFMNSLGSLHKSESYFEIEPSVMFVGYIKSDLVVFFSDLPEDE